jgi:hypothetical protein
VYARSVYSLPTSGRGKAPLSLETENSFAIPKSFSSKEAFPNMPSRSNDDGLHDRMNRFEDKFDERIEKFDDKLDGLEKLIQAKTGRTVTWKHVAAFCSFCVVILLPLVGLVVKAFDRWILPERIESVVSNSKNLKADFSELIDLSLDKKLAANLTLKTIGEDTKIIREELQSLKSVVKSNVAPKNVARKLKHHAAVSRKNLSENLTEIQHLLAAVEELRIPLKRQDYNDLSTRLYRQYATADEPEVRGQFLETFVSAANAKSVSEPELHKVPDVVFARAKKSGKYFEGTIDLSSRPKWDGAVFNNCTILISKPDVPVVLKNVRFLNCNFDEVSESPKIRDLLSTYLESTRSTVTFPGYKVLIDYVPGKPVTRS